MKTRRFDLDNFVSLVKEMRRNQKGVGQSPRFSLQYKGYEKKAKALENKVDDQILAYYEHQGEIEF